MANNIISQYYTKNDGMQISNDYQFSILQGNEKIINKNSGEKFVKNPSYSNVFDKTNTFADCLNDDRSTSIASIDDATASGVCSCKNSSGTQIDTFTCHVPVNNSAPTLNWGQTSTIGTVDGTPLTVKMPANPDIDTKYSAGKGLTLRGTEFSISQEYFNNVLRYDDRNNGYYRYKVVYKEKGEEIPSSVGGSGMTYPISGWYIIGYSAEGDQSSYELISTPQELLDKINNSGSSEPWYTFYFTDHDIDVGDVVSGSKLYNDRDLTSCVGSGSWRFMWKDVNSNYSSGGPSGRIFFGKFQKVG